VPVFPGVATPTDVQAALELGIDVVKFFPADINGGLPAIKALAGPFGSVRFVPTGGISEANLATYLAHPSILAVGGSWLVARPLIAAHDWNSISELVAAAVTIAAASSTQGSNPHG
jgi:2-dehydro-3-deoxyphosphogluconate aldolase/(4S)-4-hydroxy-2-oxoglutarate aldolase